MNCKKIDLKYKSYNKLISINESNKKFFDSNIYDILWSS